VVRAVRGPVSIIFECRGPDRRPRAPGSGWIGRRPGVRGGPVRQEGGEGEGTRPGFPPGGGAGEPWRISGCGRVRVRDPEVIVFYSVVFRIGDLTRAWTDQCTARASAPSPAAELSTGVPWANRDQIEGLIGNEFGAFVCAEPVRRAGIGDRSYPQVINRGNAWQTIVWIGRFVVERGLAFSADRKRQWGRVKLAKSGKR